MDEPREEHRCSICGCLCGGGPLARFRLPNGKHACARCNTDLAKHFARTRVAKDLGRPRHEANRGSRRFRD